MVFTAVGRTCQYYWDNLPSNTATTVGKSALFSFTALLLLRSSKGNELLDLAPPLKAAGIAAAASFIHALITPIFNALFGNKEIVFYREFMKRAVTMAILLPSLQYMTASQVNLVVKDFFKIIAISTITSLLKLFFVDINTDPASAATSTRNLRAWGLYPEPGTNSVYIS